MFFGDLATEPVGLWIYLGVLKSPYLLCSDYVLNSVAPTCSVHRSDVGRLAIQWLIVAVITRGLIVTLRDKKGRAGWLGIAEVSINGEVELERLAELLAKQRQVYSSHWASDFSY